ncbi:hypothetical protein SAMN05421823_103440 [Catalinimonas alkaloidigena]|uniref:DUF3108 domain-containing protein n=1 Tax=Catalinimonas alkaloidigena TaxID=1075417 RepID=A0A1G9EE23_9BACT|nr:hypothetical protein [Catalinimonas alkaloidigena]SDK74389.1 hypothetical protein SAMN05421823_103440 [Catalinimonas alkaloidigena]
MKIFRWGWSCLLALFTLLSASAQECIGYFPVKNVGDTFEMKSYTSNGKASGRVVYKVTAIDQTGDRTEAQIHSSVYDKKDKLTAESDFTFFCEDGMAHVDMQMFVPQDQSKNFQNMDVELTGDHLTLPYELSAGQTLPESQMSLTAHDKASGMKMSEMQMAIKNRKVEGKEAVTTESGTFDAWKLTQDLESRVGAMGITVPMNLSSVDYFVPGVGMVRSESYRKGKLVGYSELVVE